MAAAGAAAALLACAAGAQAATLISIGLQEPGVNGGAITDVASGATVASWVGSYGSYSTATVDGALASNPLTLLGNAIDVTSSKPSTLDVWITVQNLTSPAGMANFVSSSTSNTLPAGWTLTAKTFYDPANGLFSTADPLSSKSYSTIGSNVQTSGAVSLASPYSLTEEFELTSSQAPGGANSTLDVTTSGVPEPAAWSLMLLGVGLVGAGLRRGRRAARWVETAA